MVSWSATGGDGTGANVYAQSFSAAGDPQEKNFRSILRLQAIRTLLILNSPKMAI